mgnify:FL=1
MDFLNGKIKTLYFKYLAAAFGSALITSTLNDEIYEERPSMHKSISYSLLYN